FHDSIHGRQAQSRAFAHFFGGEEGFKNAVERNRVHAATRIGDTQANKFAGARFRVHQRGSVIELPHAGGNYESSAARHGVARVHGQVHQHLFDHARVAINVRQIGKLDLLEGDIFADEPLQHLSDIFDDL